MSQAGVQTTNLGTTSVMDEIIGNRGGNTVRQTMTALGNQLVGDGPVADAITGIEDKITSGLVVAATWTDLVAYTPTVNGAGGEVLDTNSGTHAAATATGYDGATINNAGRYVWNLAWGRWVRTGDTGLSAKASKTYVDAQLLLKAAAVHGHSADQITDGAAKVAMTTAERMSILNLNETVQPYLSRLNYEYSFLFTDTDAYGGTRVLGGFTSDGHLIFETISGDGADMQLFRTRQTQALLVEVDQDGKIVREVHETPPRENQLALEDFKSRAIYSGLPIVSPDGKIIGVIPASEIDWESERAKGYPANDIRAFVPDIDLTGVADESIRLKAAHDACAAAGFTEMFIEGPINAPTALFLGNVHFRSLSGKGRLIGTYRKRVIPMAAQSLPTLGDLVPATHLARFNAAVAAASPSDPAIITYMSDSWGNPNNLISYPSQFHVQLQRAIWAQYGRAAPIKIVSRAIGASKWSDAAGIGDESRVDWYSNPAAPWLDYVTSIDLSAEGLSATSKPALVFLMFGQNHSTVMSPSDFDDITTVVDAVQAITPTPDVVLVAGPTPSSMAAGRGQKAEQESRRSMAGVVRSFAAVRDLGLIDMGRIFDAAHWGYDFRMTEFRRIDASAATALPYSFAEETVDFGLHVQNAGGAATFWDTGDGKLTIPLSDVPGNALELELDVSGKVAYTIYAATGRISVARTVSALDGATVPDLEIAAEGPNLYVQWNEQSLFAGPVHRGGGLFTPTIGFDGTYSLDVELIYAAIGEHPSITPWLSDEQAWGEVDGDTGGNDENHLGERGRDDLFTRVFLETRFL